MTKRMTAELARFLLVGASAALTNTLIIVVFTELTGLHYLISYALCFLIVTGGAYLLNRGWTFSVEAPASSGEASRYFGLSLLAVAIAMTVTWVMVELGVPYYFALFATSAFMAPVNFMLHRMISFRLGGVPQ